jgi:hypothetical protein
MGTEKDYPLTIEILSDNPCGAMLDKGQICKARYWSESNSDFLVFDDDTPNAPWSICNEEAKLVK